MSRAKSYTFQEQYKLGKEYEDKFVDYFSKWFDIEVAPLEQQRKGFDFTFYPKYSSDPPRTVELKTDTLTRKTGNVAIEWWSVMEQGRYGWAWTSQADIIVYIALPNTCYIFQPGKIREQLDRWVKQYGMRNVKNKGYTSAIIPVPVSNFVGYCEATMELDW